MLRVGDGNRPNATVPYTWVPITDVAAPGSDFTGLYFDSNDNNGNDD